MLQYDSGYHDATLAKALEVSRWSSFAARREEATARGKLRGIGIVTYIEACGLAPSRVARQLGARGGLFESANVRVNPSGDITVFTGSHNHGQGHETVFAQLVGKPSVPRERFDARHYSAGNRQQRCLRNAAQSSSLAVCGSNGTTRIDGLVRRSETMGSSPLPREQKGDVDRHSERPR
jgi:carbon-monoxide dehydrogenase large subunit